MGTWGTVASNLVDAASQRLYSTQVRHKVGSGLGQLKDKGIADAVATARKDWGEYTKDMTPEQIKALRDGGDEFWGAVQNAEKARADQITGGIQNMVGGVKDWFTAADAGSMGKGRTMTLAKRYGALAGGSVALGTAGRMMNGGTLTQDNRGRQDIAGIPFI